MTQRRLTKLDNILTLIHALAGNIEGLTLDEMADLILVDRRTVERLRNVILIHFDLEEIADGRRKRFRISDSPGPAYARPNAREVAALEAVVDAGQRDGTANARALATLLSKIKLAFDSAGRRRLDNDLDLLTRLQRSRVPAGPIVDVSPEDLTEIQAAILSGHCVEFDYRPDGAETPSWRRVVPYGLMHGPVTYLLGKMPDRDDSPYTFRLDRMTNVRASEVLGCPPEDWDLDAWLADSFGIWREDDHDIVLRVLAPSVPKARSWRFHPAQTVVEDGETLLVRFRAGGLREIADHLFTWGGNIVIEGPPALRDVMRERLTLAQSALASLP